MESIWKKDVALPERPRLEGELSTDVLVIGGGLAGVLCAHRLQNAGVDCVLLEAERVGDGTTGNTTAKISAAHGLIYKELLRRFGRERAALYYKAQRKAIQNYRRLCERIDCDFEQKDAYLYLRTQKAPLEKELEALDALGIPAEWTSDLPLPFRVAGAIRYKNEAQLHPLKFLAAIAEPLRIFEHSRVVDLLPHRAVTAHGSVRAKKIVVATHFPFLNKHGGYFLKQYQHRSYVLALENAPDLNGMYLDASGEGLSFRNYNGLLLLGGGGHRTGKQGGAWQLLSDLATLHYPNARKVAKWAAQDCMTLDGMPYVGQYGKHTPNLLVMTGFNKWGMTGAMTAAMVIEDLILQKPTPSAALFSPQRSIWHPQLACNVLESALGLITPSRRRCPHLGCALKWNPAEHSWDCPCHGSRFSETGELLNNPANGDLKQ